VASAWQLQTTLGALLAVEVGGCCSAWVFNHLHASKIERASGVVILRAVQRGRAS
jgi:hypothetical protein